MHSIVSEFGEREGGERARKREMERDRVRK